MKLKLMCCPNNDKYFELFQFKSKNFVQIKKLVKFPNEK